MPSDLFNINIYIIDAGDTICIHDTKYANKFIKTLILKFKNLFTTSDLKSMRLV